MRVSIERVEVTVSLYRMHADHLQKVNFLSLTSTDRGAVLIYFGTYVSNLTVLCTSAVNMSI